jgi:hypothetical protein
MGPFILNGLLTLVDLKGLGMAIASPGLLIGCVEFVSYYLHLYHPPVPQECLRCRGKGSFWNSGLNQLIQTWSTHMSLPPGLSAAVWFKYACSYWTSSASTSQILPVSKNVLSTEHDPGMGSIHC